MTSGPLGLSIAQLQHAVGITTVVGRIVSGFSNAEAIAAVCTTLMRSRFILGATLCFERLSAATSVRLCLVWK